MNNSDHFYEYQMRLQGHLDEYWFDGLEIAQTPAGETVISGMFDQSALHGLLTRIRDLGLVLISVQRGPSEDRNLE
jgi:hypothetical protein